METRPVTIFYKRLSDERVAILNGPQGGWNCASWARAYANLGLINETSAEARVTEAAALGLYEPAARTEITDHEEIWTAMQNGAVPWTENSRLDCLTDFPRSMCVGDLILSDTDLWACVDLGFHKIAASDDLLENLTAMETTKA